jgi:hypothetical protein
MDDCAHTIHLGNLLHGAVIIGIDASLTAPHPVVKIQDVGLDLVAHPIPGEMRHLQHVDETSRVALAPFDQRMQYVIEIRRP